MSIRTGLQFKRMNPDIQAIIRLTNKRKAAGADWTQADADEWAMLASRKNFANKKHYAERLIAEQDFDTYNLDMDRLADKPSFKRPRNERPDSGIPDPDLAKGAGEMKQKTKADSDYIKGYGWKAHDRPVAIDYGHVLSVKGSEGTKLTKDATPLTWSKLGDDLNDRKYLQIPTRGPDTGKTAFPESRRFNVHMGANNSYTLEEVRTLGRPATWAEAIADNKAFGKANMIDIDPVDWLRLQQKTITADQLVAHKLAVNAAAENGDIFLDALSDHEAVRVVDYHEGKASIRRHEKKDYGLVGKRAELPFEEATTLPARNLQRKMARNPEDYKVRRLSRGAGIKPGVDQLSGRISRADTLMQLGLNVTTGNVPGAVMNVGMLGSAAALQSPAVQKRMATMVAELASKRAMSSSMKLIPGVDIAMSGVEAWSYFVEGKFDQATIAALSGAIGWVPGLGDFGAAMLDAGNTWIDIQRFDVPNRQQDGTEIVSTPDSTDRRSIAELTEKGEDLGAWASEVDANKKMRRVRNRGLNIDNAALRGLSRAL